MSREEDRGSPVFRVVNACSETSSHVSNQGNSYVPITFCLSHELPASQVFMLQGEMCARIRRTLAKDFLPGFPFCIHVRIVFFFLIRPEPFLVFKEINHVPLHKRTAGF